MKVAIMQPYLFPYIGYFQLMNAVDTFVIYDDVSFIKQGWINRNKILVQKESFLFTIPLKNQSSFSNINEVFINDKLYKTWLKKYLRTVEQAYIKAPFFNQVYNILKKVLDIESEHTTISELATKSLLEVNKYLNIEKKIVLTSAIYNNSSLKGEARILDICKSENIVHYVNPIGGTALYAKAFFKEKGVKLSFLKTKPIEYLQFKNEFIPWLSIIDVLMFNSVKETKLLLNNYELI